MKGEKTSIKHVVGIFPDVYNNHSALQDIMKFTLRQTVAKSQDNHLLVIEIPNGGIGQWNWDAVDAIEQLLQQQYPINTVKQKL